MSRPSVIYSLPRAYGNHSCVYKLSADDRYVIVKAKDHLRSIESIQKALNQFLRNSKGQRSRDNLYYYFFEYIESREEVLFSVEILFASDNPYELLKEEHKAICASVTDKKCLQNAVSPYIPAYNEDTGMYGWIPKTAVMNYIKWTKGKAV